MLTIIYILVAVLGLCVGSFLNVVIYRVPNKMSIAFPNSHCPNCKEPIKWYDNIPLFSYIFLRGKCRHCNERISIKYPFVELLNAIMWVLCLYVFYRFGAVVYISFMIVSSILIVISFIDFEHMIILDRFQIMLLIIGVVLCVFGTDLNFADRLIGFAVGGLVMALFYGLG